MRGPDYVPKKKAKKAKKAAKVEKALGWGGFDDQAKATQARLCTQQPLRAAPRGLHWLQQRCSSRVRAPALEQFIQWRTCLSCLVFVDAQVADAAWMRMRLLSLLALRARAAVQQRDGPIVLKQVHVLSLNMCMTV
jgi:hypothetical protein